MSLISSYLRDSNANNLEICINSLGRQTEPCKLLTYFEQFGIIERYNFKLTNDRGLVFIVYQNRESVDRCMSSRPHRIDNELLSVKRAIPCDPIYPREHVTSSRDLMIVNESINVNEECLQGLRDYFSFYGTLYACKCSHEKYFDYFLIEFADYDQVDRIILDKPHYFNGQQLNIMKYIPINRTILNQKYSMTTNTSVNDNYTTENDDNSLIKFDLNYKRSNFDQTDELINENDLENEVYRLQNILKELYDNYNVEKKQFENDYCEQLRKLNENADKNHCLQQNLEQEYSTLLSEYESLKSINENLNEQYLSSELENFEITSYYEQILAEEKAKTARYEIDYKEKLETFFSNQTIELLNSKFPSPSTTRYDDDDD